MCFLSSSCCSSAAGSRWPTGRIRGCSNLTSTQPPRRRQRQHRFTMALELLQAHRDESLHHQFNMRGRRTSSTERPSSTWRSMSQPSDPVKDASRKAKQKAADIQHELEEFRAAEQDAALGTARPHDLVAHGAKKSGASQEGVKTNKGKILVS